MKLKPLHENVVLVPLIAEDKIGEIYIPTKKEKTEGKIIAVAEDVEVVKVGDIVGYRQYAGDLVESTDPKENRILMDVHDILYVRT